MTKEVGNIPPRSPALFLKPENLFLLVGTLYGILFLLTIPPFLMPDETNHFYRAYQISEGHFIATKRPSPPLDPARTKAREEKAKKIRSLFTKGEVEAVVKAFYEVKDMGGIGGVLPQSLAVTTSAFIRLLHPENKQDINDISPLLALPLARNNKIFLHFPNTAVYSPVPYLPQALGIELGKIFDLPPLLLMYLGRLFNLLAWLTLVYFSIRLIPVFKWGFFLLALTPVSVAEASSLSADSLTIAVSFLLISILVGTALNKSGGDANIFLILLVSVILALSKQAYLFIPLLFLLMPAERIGSRKKFFVVFVSLNLLTTGAVLLFTLKADIYKDIYAIYGFLVPTFSPEKQTSFIISHPFEFCRILGSTILQNGPTFVGELFQFPGIRSELLSAFYVMMLVFVILGEPSQGITVSLRQRAVIFLSLSLGVMAVLTLSYIGWTPVGDKVVAGVQGRYFIPLAPLFLLLFCRKRRLFTADKALSAVIFSFFSCSALAYALLLVYQRFYV